MGGDLDPPFNTWFLEHTQVLNPNGILIGSAVFAGLTTVIDHATRSVTIGHIYSRYVVLQCGLSTIIYIYVILSR